MKKHLLVTAALWLGATACVLNPPGVCDGPDDCKAGTSCVIAAGATEGLCLENTARPCDLNCGEGFSCKVSEAGVEGCQLAEGQTVSVTVTSPAAGAVFGREPISLACTASGPQLAGLKFLVTPPSGEVVELPAVQVGAGPHTATYEPAAGVEGSHAVVCEAMFGPAGFEQRVPSSPGTFGVDATAPEITSTSPTAWYRREGTATVTATIVDGGTPASGVASATLVIGSLTVTGTAGAGGTYTFVVDLTQVGSPTTAGVVSYELRSADQAGNEADPVAGGLQIDATAPVVSWTPDLDWHARAGTVTVTATASSEATGAPIATAVLSDVDGTEPTAGMLVGGDWSFALDPTRYLPAGGEAEVPLRLAVTDAAGNSATVDGFVRLDDRAPQLTFATDGSWNARAASVPVTVTAVDGAGVSPTTVRVQGGSPCPPGPSNTFTCTVSTANAASGQETLALAFTIEAADVLAHSTTANGTLKVDDLAPVVTLAVDGTWYRRDATVVVRGTAADSGAGIATGTIPQLEVRLGTTLARTIAGLYDPTDGAITFQVPGDVAPAGATTPTISVTARINDAVGKLGASLPANQFRVDDQPPSVTGVSVRYPAQPVAAGKLLRRDPTSQARHEGAVCATVSDAGSGLATGGVVLVYTRNDGTDAAVAASGSVDTRCGSATHSFPLDASDMKFSGAKPAGGTYAAEDMIPFQVRADDDVANRVSSAGNVQVTRKLWERAPGAAVRVIGSPAVTSDLVYVSLADLGRPNLFALEKQGGAARWSTTVAGTPTTPPAVGTSQTFVASEAAGNNTVSAYARSANGTTTSLWTCSTTGSVRGALGIAQWNWGGSSKEMVVSAAQTAIRAAYQNGATCISSAVSAAGLTPSSSTIAIDNLRVWFGGTVGRIGSVLADPAGEFFEATQSLTLGAQTIPGVAIRANGNAYVISGRIDEVNTNMTSVGTASASGVPTAPPSLLDDPRAFLGTDAGILYRYPAAAPNAPFPVTMPGSPAPAIRSTPTLGAAGGLYLVTDDGAVRAYTTAGVAQWSYETGAGLSDSSSLPLDCSGVLYAGTSDGRVIALVTDDLGLADSNWPRYQHDNRNTGNTATEIWTAGGVCRD